MNVSSISTQDGNKSLKSILSFPLKESLSPTLYCVQDKAQNKTLPYNILEFNEEFAKGCFQYH